MSDSLNKRRKLYGLACFLGKLLYAKRTVPHDIRMPWLAKHVQKSPATLRRWMAELRAYGLIERAPVNDTVGFIPTDLFKFWYEAGHDFNAIFGAVFEQKMSEQNTKMSGQMSGHPIEAIHNTTYYEKAIEREQLLKTTKANAVVVSDRQTEGHFVPSLADARTDKASVTGTKAKENKTSPSRTDRTPPKRRVAPPPWENLIEVADERDVPPGHIVIRFRGNSGIHAVPTPKLKQYLNNNGFDDYIANRAIERLKAFRGRVLTLEGYLLSIAKDLRDGALKRLDEALSFKQKPFIMEDWNKQQFRGVKKPDWMTYDLMRDGVVLHGETPVMLRWKDDQFCDKVTNWFQLNSQPVKLRSTHGVYA